MMYGMKQEIKKSKNPEIIHHTSDIKTINNRNISNAYLIYYIA